MTITYCCHWIDDKHVPCPPMCQRQCWPRYMFRRRWFGSGYVLRRKYRKQPALAGLEAEE